MVQRRKGAGLRWALVAVSVGAALVLAACGGSSSSSKSSSSSAKSSAPAPAPSASGGVTISTAKGPMGTYLTDSSGRALYLWVADANGKSSCSGACAQTWSPLAASATPKASGAVQAADLGTITRSDGTKQVTYGGHPLYTYAQDSGKGMTNGEGSSSFGAKWWLVAPSGQGITKAASTSGSSKSGGSSSGSSTPSGWG